MLQGLFDWLEKRKYANRPLRPFTRWKFGMLETKFAFHCKVHPLPAWAPGGDLYQLLEYSNGKDRSLLVSLAETNTNQHLRCYLLNVPSIDGIRRRDYDHFLPLKDVSTYLNLPQMKSRHFSLQLSGREELTDDYLLVFEALKDVLLGNSWITQPELYKALYDKGTYIFPHPKELLRFVEKAREAFVFLLNEHGFQYRQCSDWLPFFMGSFTDFVEYLHPTSGLRIKLSFDPKEQVFQIQYFRKEDKETIYSEKNILTFRDAQRSSQFDFLQAEAEKLQKQIDKILE
ncbi:MAG: hypothetical protein AAFV95_20800 [Bacteroidota bacterium]